MASNRKQRERTIVLHLFVVQPRRAAAPSRSTCADRTGGTILSAVGFNPFRPRHTSAADVVMVAAALVVCAALVAWALFG